jgi:hypothetical protein
VELEQLGDAGDLEHIFLEVAHVTPVSMEIANTGNDKTVTVRVQDILLSRYFSFCIQENAAERRIFGTLWLYLRPLPANNWAKIWT